MSVWLFRQPGRSGASLFRTWFTFGKNETFEIYGIGITSFNLEIFDRWGELLYSGERGWDGSVINSSEPAKQDVYVYKINFTTIFGEQKNQVGRVTLVR